MRFAALRAGILSFALVSSVLTACTSASIVLQCIQIATFTLALMYDLHRGLGEADIPVKFSGVWGLNDLFGVKGLVFKGFIDVWGNNAVWGPDDETKFSVLSEPQLWFNLGDVFDGHLDVGTEVELSVNFAGHKGFMCNPCAGLRWTF